MSLFEGTMPAADVVMCLVAVLFMAGILCTFFLPHTRRRHTPLGRECPYGRCGCPWRQQVVDLPSPETAVAPKPVNQETYINNPPERSQVAVDRPVLQSPDKCKSDYELCMSSLGPVNQQTVLTSKPVRTVSYPLDIVSGVERRLASHVPPMSPMALRHLPTNLMTH